MKILNSFLIKFFFTWKDSSSKLCPLHRFCQVLALDFIREDRSNPGMKIDDGQENQEARSFQLPVADREGGKKSFPEMCSLHLAQWA